MDNTKNRVRQIHHWQATFKEHWGVEAKLSPLDGEYDLNFLANSASGQGYVLKVMRSDCETWLVDMQVKAFEHITAHQPHLPCPRIIRSVGDQPLLKLADENGEERLVWVLNQLPGYCYAKAEPKGNVLIHEVGKVLGGTAKALASFQHEGLERDFKWNLMHAGWIKDQLPCITDPARRTIIEDISAEFDALEPNLTSLPMQAIHNDANDYNIMVEGKLNEPRKVSGLIDLGDMCMAARICDLAIAAAYIVLDHDSPESAIAALVAGYHQAYPFTATEIGRAHV